MTIQAGEQARIIGRFNGHDFPIGEIVTIKTTPATDVNEYYEAVSAKGELWWIKDTEFEKISDKTLSGPNGGSAAPSGQTPNASEPSATLPQVGDRVKLISPLFSLGPYNDGDIVTVSAVFPDGVIAVHVENECVHIYYPKESYTLIKAAPKKPPSVKLGEMVLAFNHGGVAQLGVVLHTTEQGCLLSLCADETHQFTPWGEIYVVANR